MARVVGIGNQSFESIHVAFHKAASDKFSLLFNLANKVSFVAKVSFILA